MNKRRNVSWGMLLIRLLPVFLVALTITPVKAGETNISPSQAYVKAMGVGWNLGNSFDGFNDEGKSDETSWGNPVVTQAFIKSIKAKGYDSIRIPLTVHTRYSKVNGEWVIDEAWLNRYAEVVQWAVDADLYVMINLHHDSWIWLSDWDGDKTSDQYLMFESFWKQLSKRFKDFEHKVCFETINEPQFNSGSDEEKQQKLDDLNKSAYDIIRKSEGNNKTRMIVMPTMHTNHEKCEPLLAFIQTLNDKNIIATFHYYSQWVYSANLGITGFDEILWDNETPRTSLVSAFDTVQDAFAEDEIGVILGEFGLLGYDAGENALQVGEELKYYEFAHQYARKTGFSIMFWDNGSGINRRAEGFPWKKAVVGNMLQASMAGRSSYATGLDTVYIKEGNVEEVSIPLTLNGNNFTGIKGLIRGRDYTYKDETVTLHKAYVKEVYDKRGKDKYGVFADLVFEFSSGAEWHQYLVKFKEAKFSNASGTNEKGISIPVKFNGSTVRRASAVHNEVKVGPNNWWKWLEYPQTYEADYKSGTINIKKTFFSALEPSVTGNITFEIEFYDGTIVKYILNRAGSEEGSKIAGKLL